MTHDIIKNELMSYIYIVLSVLQFKNFCRKGMISVFVVCIIFIIFIQRLEHSIANPEGQDAKYMAIKVGCRNDDRVE